ncbi:MAG: hypothetical protein ACOX0O_00450 [Candidatus Methanoculleus thermohydrogenotrophicum]
MDRQPVTERRRARKPPDPEGWSRALSRRHQTDHHHGRSDGPQGTVAWHGLPEPLLCPEIGIVVALALRVLFLLAAIVVGSLPTSTRSGG